MPSTAVSGVRISWLIAARNSVLARLACSAASRASQRSLDGLLRQPFVRFLQCRLAMPFVGDVAIVADIADRPPGLVDERRLQRLQQDRDAARMMDGLLDQHGLPAGMEGKLAIAIAARHLGRKKVEVAPADERCRRAGAHQRSGRRVGGNEAALQILGEDHVGKCRDHCPVGGVLAPLFRELDLGSLAVGDVDHVAVEVALLLRRRLGDPGDLLHPALLAGPGRINAVLERVGVGLLFAPTLRLEVAWKIVRMDDRIPGGRRRDRRQMLGVRAEHLHAVLIVAVRAIACDAAAEDDSPADSPPANGSGSRFPAAADWLPLPR